MRVMYTIFTLFTKYKFTQSKNEKEVYVTSCQADFKYMYISWILIWQFLTTLWFWFFDAVFASKGYPFKNIFDFTTAGDWDCVAAVERLPALHYSVDFIFLSFGIMDFIL